MLSPTPSFLVHRISRVALAAVALGAGGCRSVTDRTRADPVACPQTYEFGNFGCARIVALVEGPPTPWPARYRFDVRAVPARSSSGATVTIAPEPGVGPVPLQLTLWGGPASAEGDTLSVWIVARLLEDPAPPVVGVPLRTFAADSTLRVIRFAKVGAVPPVDSVPLLLRGR